MGLLQNRDVNAAYRRTLAKCTMPCIIKEIREKTGEVGEDGKPAKDTTFITLQLQKDGKTTDGDDFKSGATIDVSLQYAPNPNGDSKLETMNRISMERTRELIIAGLRLPPNTKDPIGELEKNGGPSALNGRAIIVDFSPSKRDGNNVDKFSRVPDA